MAGRLDGSHLLVQGHAIHTDPRGVQCFACNLEVTATSGSDILGVKKRQCVAGLPVCFTSLLISRTNFN